MEFGYSCVPEASREGRDHSLRLRSQMEYKMDKETARCRSSTWPLPEPAQMGLEPGSDGLVTVKSESPPECESPVPPAPKSEPKKMRNAWGNMSYAELITQAVLSSPEKRLTLSEIYEWIVRNVPYFSDKASSPSTAGWKVLLGVGKVWDGDRWD